ncbi:MAG: HAD hydrolase-like protein [Ferruginibacter sp.]
MHNPQIKLAVFDIAGTTVKDKGNVANAFMQAFNKHGYSIPGTEVHTLMGYKKTEAIKIMLEKYFPGAISSSRNLVAKIHETFTAGMISFYETDPSLEPMPDAEYVFSQLQSRDIKVALNTGFGSLITEVILKRLGWNRTQLIDFVISSDEVKYGRPHPLMIQAAMKALHIEHASQVVKIGDTEVDIAEGRNAGCGLVVAVTTGAYTKEQLLPFQPDAIIGQLKEILTILKTAAVAN